MSALVRSLLARILLFYTLIGCALFIPAGRLDWWAGWAYLILHATFSAGLVLWCASYDPDLLAERSNAEAHAAARVDKIVLMVVRVLTLALYITAGLDAGRFVGSNIPVPARVVGFILVITAGLLIFWVMRTNTFASVVVRVQAERGHHVIEGGPYHYIRHPMYLANLTLFLALPLMLGSWWAYIPAALLALAFFYRTAQEDRFLRRDLDGYAAFATRTRYRLIPGVW